jgi:hypothetical protein
VPLKGCRSINSQANCGTGQQCISVDDVPQSDNFCDIGESPLVLVDPMFLSSIPFSSVLSLNIVCDRRSSSSDLPDLLH